MSEFLTEKELFQKTFGGTTFNHFIEWCKKMHSSCEHTQINSITRPDRIFFIRMNKIVIALTINTIENYMDLDECFDNRCREHGCDKATIEKCYSYMRFNPAVEAPRHYIRKTLKK